jgi:hypothetical protein
MENNQMTPRLPEASSSRSAAASDEFLAELLEEWDGNGRNLLIEIEELRNRTWGRSLQTETTSAPAKCIQSTREPASINFPRYIITY